MYALAAMATLAFVILDVAFYRSDFSFNVVAEHSSTTTPTFYKLAAAWATQEGSLLLWVLLLSLWSSLALFLTATGRARSSPYAHAVLFGFVRVLHGAGDVLRQPVRDQRQPARPRAPGSIRCCATRR